MMLDRTYVCQNDNLLDQSPICQLHPKIGRNEGSLNSVILLPPARCLAGVLLLIEHIINYQRPMSMVPICRGQTELLLPPSNMYSHQKELMCRYYTH